ncbi:hypothetical protein Rs2_42442 [Raphanus sativus]|nr:hypothetical protein Rs2_42442 [Raphanus sativus]
MEKPEMVVELETETVKSVIHPIEESTKCGIPVWRKRSPVPPRVVENSEMRQQSYRYCRGWLARKKFYLQRETTICIQSAIREFDCIMSFHGYKHAATELQRLVRGQIVRSRFQGD